MVNLPIYTVCNYKCNYIGQEEFIPTYPRGPLNIKNRYPIPMAYQIDDRDQLIESNSMARDKGAQIYG